jgi:hypothetical protein
MPFKEYDSTVQVKVNTEALRQNIKQIKLHIRQLEHENRYSNPVEKLNNLFKRKEEK